MEYSTEVMTIRGIYFRILILNFHRGDYYLITHDHIAYRYEIIGALGKGSFGQVAKCYDHKEKKYIALKIIRNKKRFASIIFNITSRFEKQGKIEVQVLDKIRIADHDQTHNCVHMLDHFHFRGHLCITFELLGANLYEWLKVGGFKGVNSDLVRVFSRQILECLCLMRQNRIIHCDLKPEVRFYIFIL
jgi:dual specificity tyrosine-phosphorylation-regulated kinase 2/3/4